MGYKDGSKPAAHDSVMGSINGVVVRGKVLHVDAAGDIIVFQRRKAYEVDAQKRRLLAHPLATEQHELPAKDFDLVYRHVPRVAAVTPSLADLAAQAKALAKKGRK